jgi:peptidoglycan/LPS O-acetylase OafA/YrhL
VKTAARNHQLDGLRGIAATAVVFYHAILHADDSLVQRVLLTPIQELTSVRDIVSKLALMAFDGEEAVMIFFVLSGLVLHLSLQREPAGSLLSITTRFTVQRLCRILPAVIVCMLAIYAVSKAYLFLGLSGFPQVTADQLWRNALLVQITIHGPSGSVQTELAAIPILLACFFISRRFGSLALVLCFLFAIIQIQYPILLFRYANLWPSGCVFVGGMLLALPEARSWFARIGPGTAAANLCFFMICRHVVPNQSITALVAQTISCVILVGTTAYATLPLLTAVLQSKAVQFLGRTSYSLYLLNVFVLLCLWSIPDLSTPTRYAVEIGMLVGSASLLITLPLAYASERWVERTGIALGRVLTSRSGPRPAQISAAKTDSDISPGQTSKLAPDGQEL